MVGRFPYETDCFIKPSCYTAVKQSPMKLSAVFRCGFLARLDCSAELESGVVAKCGGGLPILCRSSINRFEDPKSIFARPVGPDTYADAWSKVHQSRLLNGKSTPLGGPRSQW